jgi:membrane protease YdiL (CAAX protease family)
MPETLSIFHLVQAWALIAIAVGLLMLPLWRLRPRGWPPQRRRALAWGGVHVVAAFAIFWIMPQLIRPLISVTALSHWFFGGEVNIERAQVLAYALSGTLALPLQLLAWRGLLATVEPHPVPAISPHPTVRDLRAGFLTWLVVTPAVYGVGLVTLMVYARLGGHADQHPIMKAMEGGPVPTGVLLLILAETVIAAPVREELLFRGILLPWMADRSWGGDFGLALAAAAGVALRPPIDHHWANPMIIASRFGPAILVLALAPLSHPGAHWPLLRRLLPIRNNAARAQVIRAIVGSAAIFACVHSNVWPTPIPLAVLALALGWLAMRTQSIIAPIVVHILFNAVAMTELALN